ncbi:type II secretion system minor pseudopilin GspI [Stakelama sp. CBK3Z-3]|uniref:Type II secretion system protein I n=1 Tax=Stakelama flava TaxID=2860338 RepID=A0ABS6XJD8_9SPHN|nr:type II secretion system minor pseudopilin GspI [Stakelama flava]MBW4330310.1 type II secretion system minor pseudopilin GspI [Stakelama flava]
MSGNEAGFSLIEALVALAVLAIATVGLMGAVESHIDSTLGVQRRATAMLIAQNRLAELQAGAPEAGSPRVEMLGQQWQVSMHQVPTSDPQIARVAISVGRAGDAGSLATLDGFLDTGKTR